MKISVVIAVHNEAEYLSYALKRLQPSPIHEFIFVLDRCTDNSEEIARKFIAKTNAKCKIITKTFQKGLNPAFESFDFGAQYATGDFIYYIGADIAVDPKIFNAENWRERSALKFRYYNYNLFGSKVPYAYEKVIIKLSEKLGAKVGQCFVEAFRRDFWKKFWTEHPPENLEGFLKEPKFTLKHILAEDDRKMFINITTTECLHLRPKLTRGQQLLQGIARYLLNYPFPKVLFHSILYFKIYVLLGYLQARRGLYGDLKKLAKNVT
jgi:glycosyltransferase involved in cell wall biosynthesis